MPSEVTQLRPRGRRVIRWAVLVIAAVAMCAVFPPIRIVRTDSTEASPRPAGKLSASEFWEQRLTNSLDKAVDAKELVPAIRRDPDAAMKKYGRRVGLGGAYYYFVRGTGKIVSKDANAIAVAVGDEKEPAVSMETGLVFGNAVRDGTGLLDVNDYGNSKEFNELSDALNKLVEQRVLPGLREQAEVGKEVQFTGVAEVVDESTDLRTLRVVPVAVEVR